MTLAVIAGVGMTKFGKQAGAHHRGASGARRCSPP